jgi:Omp85 superfamily domain
MKTLGLLLALLCAPLVAAAQDVDLHEGALIESAEVQGLALDRLSPELRRDIQALADQRLSRERIDALASRIEAEHPDVITAARDVLRPDGRVRVIFLVAPIGDDTGLAANINARYTIERVEIAGVDEKRISQKLRDELQALVGGRLDPANAERLSRALEAELPDYSVTRRISRGNEAGHIVVVFNFELSERRFWIPLSPSRMKIVFHEDDNQGWSAVFDIRASFGSHMFSVGYAGGNNDDLIEEYSGYWLRAETRKAATKRVGMSFEFGSYSDDWRAATLSALDASPGIPPAYGHRTTAQPEVTFAFDQHLRFTGGADVSELEPRDDSLVSQNANAVVGRVGYDQTWRPESGGRQRVVAGYEYRAGTRSLGSDLVYGRHFGQAHYVFSHRHNRVRADLLVGGLSGQAPLFERFSLGDTLTLRGWDKYVIAPVGGDRMWHQSIEYAYRNFAYFFDAGSVWDKGNPAHVRLSTGVGYHDDNWFMTFAVPLNDRDVRLTFMIGVRAVGAVLDKR